MFYYFITRCATAKETDLPSIIDLNFKFVLQRVRRVFYKAHSDKGQRLFQYNEPHILRTEAEVRRK